MKKYGLKNKKNGELICFTVHANDDETIYEFDSTAYSWNKVWLVQFIETAQYALTHNTPWYAADHNSPFHGDCQMDDYEVVEVTLTF